MLKKITGSILTIMLMTTMFLGAAGAAVPQPVNAQDDVYWELTVTINSYKCDDIDCIGSIRGLTVKTGDVEKKEYESKKVTISNLSERPTSFAFQINENKDSRKWTERSISYYDEGVGEDSEEKIEGNL